MIKDQVDCAQLCFLHQYHIKYIRNGRFCNMNNNKVFRRYSKSMSDILNLKQDFFTDNNEWLRKNNKIRDIYKTQQKRISCKLCHTKLSSEIYFISHELNYYLCGNCGHLNGEYTDGLEFSNAIYLSDGYGEVYHEPTKENYLDRVEKIYKPKIEFFLNTIGDDFSKIKHLDVGAGSGYMVYALLDRGVTAKGIEVSTQQVQYGNRLLGKNTLESINAEHIANYIANSEINSISFIGVLEHLYNLDEILESVQRNEGIKYLFFSVPMLSLSCVLECIFPNVYNRQLGGAHTHLFTDSSIKWLFEYYHFSPIAIWKFGTDMMDLYRLIVVKLHKHNASKDFIADVSRLFVENADALQMIIDRSSFTSEIHVVAKIEH